MAEPIPLTQARYEYRVVPDVAHQRGMVVYAVQAVTSAEPGADTTVYQPFYSFRHGRTRETHQAFWYATRRPSLVEGDRGTEVYLHLVDLGFEPRLPGEPVLVVRTLCTNRELPSQLQRAGDELYLELEAAAPLERIRCLRSDIPRLGHNLSSGGRTAESADRLIDCDLLAVGRVDDDIAAGNRRRSG